MRIHNHTKRHMSGSPKIVPAFMIKMIIIKRDTKLLVKVKRMLLSQIEEAETRKDQN